MAADWSAYQEEVAEFFRSIGLSAETNKSLTGARTSHDVDVYVAIDVAGFQVNWIIECKHWKTAVSKLHVLALRTIVSDLGADRGIILCEAGFQSGAVEAANLTNIQVSSLTSLASTAKEAVNSARLRSLLDRNEVCRERYWSLDKQFRKDKGLRPEFMESGYSGATVIELTRDLVLKSFLGIFPVQVDRMQKPNWIDFPTSINTREELLKILSSLMDELEAKLDVAQK